MVVRPVAALLPLLTILSTARATWTRLGRSPADHLLDLHVAVKQSAQGIAALEKTLWAVSDPSSPSYGRHLSPADVKTLVAPASSSLRAVDAWLGGVVGAGRASLSPSGDVVRCTVTVAEAETLLGVEYYEWTSSVDGTRAHRVLDAPAFELPPAVRAHVDFVEPATRFPPRTMRARRTTRKKTTASTRFGTNPTSIRSLYNLGTHEASGKTNVSQHVAGFLNNSFSPKDLELFFTQYYPAGKGRSKTVTILGPNDAGNPTTEASLDMEYIMAVGAGVPTTFAFTPGQRPYPGGENEPFVTWLTALIDGATSGAQPLSDVISVSYADEEFVVDPAFQARADVDFMKLGAMGASLFFGSGDDGVTGDHGVCPGGQFVPWWPASSPYVTAVGSTEEYVPKGATFSGGGFSNRYGIPAYQTAAVAAYKANPAVPKAAGLYNDTGAGFPDVAAIGMGFWTVVGGIPDEVGGTSASTPTVAGIFSLLNDARVAQGKAALGNVNKLIYAHPEAFTDVTAGINSGGGGCGKGGLPAVKGWDPVTGMGTPLFDKLLALVTELP